MANNFNNLMSMYQQMMGNPIQFLSRKFNIPQNMNDPNDILQHLLNTGQVSQSQVNWAMSMKDSPLIQNLTRKV